MKMMVISINKLILEQPVNIKSVDMATLYGIKVIAFLVAGITIHCLFDLAAALVSLWTVSTIALLRQ